MLISEVVERRIKLLDGCAVGEPAVEDGEARTLLCHSRADPQVRECSAKQIPPPHSITSSANRHEATPITLSESRTAKVRPVRVVGEGARSVMRQGVRSEVARSGGAI